MFDFLTDIIGLIVTVFNAIIGLFQAIITFVGFLINVIVQGFTSATQLMSLVPVQIIAITLPCIALIVIFNFLNFVKGWV